MTARVFSWDWKQQPDLASIAAAVTELSEGRVLMREIDTGGDNYAWVISDAKVTDEQAYRLYSGEEDEPEPLTDVAMVCTACRNPVTYAGPGLWEHKDPADTRIPCDWNTRAGAPVKAMVAAGNEHVPVTAETFARKQCAEGTGCPRPVVWRWYEHGRSGEPVYLCDEHAADKDLSDLWDLTSREASP